MRHQQARHGRPCTKTSRSSAFRSRCGTERRRGWRPCIAKIVDMPLRAAESLERRVGGSCADHAPCALGSVKTEPRVPFLSSRSPSTRVAGRRGAEQHVQPRRPQGRVGMEPKSTIKGAARHCCVRAGRGTTQTAWPAPKLAAAPHLSPPAAGLCVRALLPGVAVSNNSHRRSACERHRHKQARTPRFVSSDGSVRPTWRPPSAGNVDLGVDFVPHGPNAARGRNDFGACANPPRGELALRAFN